MIIYINASLPLQQYFIYCVLKYEIKIKNEQKKKLKKRNYNLQTARQ